MLISFVIPCYRSGNNIIQVIEEIKTTMQIKPEYEYEIILVNDCSPDDTFKTLKRLAEDNKQVVAVDLAKNKGQASATMCGLRLAKGDYIVCGDDDGQTPFNTLFDLKRKLDDEDFDVICGKYTRRDRTSLFRQLGTKMNEFMAHHMLEYPKDLYLSVYFIAKKFVIDEIVKYPNPYPYITGLLVQVTSKIGNVDVPQRKRLEGNSGYTFKKLLSLWVNGFTAFSVKPLRFATVFGCIFSAVGFIATLVLIITKLVNPTIAIGWTSIMALTLIASGIILLVVGMVGEYVGRTYISINKTPQYVVRNIISSKEDTKDE